MSGREGGGMGLSGGERKKERAGERARQIKNISPGGEAVGRCSGTVSAR